MTREEWRPVTEFPRLYEVSSYGRIRTIATGRIRNLVPDRNGYLKVKLCANGVEAMRLVHRLVAFAFIGEPPTSAHQINHRDGATSHNRPANLEWVTASENALHAHRVLGTVGPRGVDHGRAKLTARQVLTIRRSVATAVALADRYGVSDVTIGRVRRGTGWHFLGRHQQSCNIDGAIFRTDDIRLGVLAPLADHELAVCPDHIEAARASTAGAR